MTLKDKITDNLESGEGFYKEDVKEVILKFEKIIKDTPFLTEGVKGNVINLHKGIFGEFD